MLVARGPYRRGFRSRPLSAHLLRLPHPSCARPEDGRSVERASGEHLGPLEPDRPDEPLRAGGPHGRDGVDDVAGRRPLGIRRIRAASARPRGQAPRPAHAHRERPAHSRSALRARSGEGDRGAGTALRNRAAHRAARARAPRARCQPAHRRAARARGGGAMTMLLLKVAGGVAGAVVAIVGVAAAVGAAQPVAHVASRSDTFAVSPEPLWDLSLAEFLPTNDGSYAIVEQDRPRRLVTVIVEKKLP